MPRLLVASALALLLFFPSIEAADWSSVVTRLDKSVVPIQCSGHQINICTAFSINERERLYMTALHCVHFPEGSGLESEEPWIDGSPVEIVFVAEDKDVAIVRAVKRRLPLALSRDRIRKGQEVAAYGFGNGWPVASVRAGIIQTLIVFQGADYVVLDNALIGGMSGGPTVDRRSRVIAVNVQSNNNTGLSVIIRAIPDLLKFFPTDE